MDAVRLTTFNLVTFILLMLTCWVVMARFTRSLESNWPLVYYLMVVAHLKAFDGGLNPYWVYVGVVTSLFLRFEFMGGAVLRAFWVIELMALGYIVWRCLGLILGW